MAKTQRVDDILIFGDADDRTLNQARRCAESAERVALMADNHLGYAQPVGGVTAFRNSVSLSGVGYDIACGNKAVLLDSDPAEIRARIALIMDEIFRRVSFGIGRKNPTPVESPALDDPLFDEPWMHKVLPGKSLKDLAAGQLGTVGSGNHYVDIFVSERGQVWIGVHFGSRGLGHKITTHFLGLAGAQDGIDAEPCVLGLDTEIGKQYLLAMQLAGRYAYAGRGWVCEEVARILGGQILREVHNHHNFAWEEEHGGERYVVVRKGATPAFPGQEGFVGGSMGDISVILEGVESPESADALYSTVHGAGRVMSRTEAAGKVKRRKSWSCGQRECSGILPIQTPINEDGSNPRCPSCGSKMHKRQTEERVREGRVSREMMTKWVSGKGVELRGAGVDESPHCYKRIEDVLAAHEGTIRVTEVLHPIGVAMAGSDEFDPYRD